MKANYTIPKLCPKDRDMAKDWFVFFRWTYVVNGKVERIPIKKRWDLNKIKDKSERIKRGKSLAEAYEKKLASGWDPITDEIQEEKKILTLKDYINFVIETKKTSFTDKSLTDYNNIKKHFFAWLDKKNYTYIYPQNFNNVMAQQYMNYLVIEKGLAGKTHNTQLGIIKSWLTAMVKLKVIEENPFNGISELPEEKGKIFAFNDEEKKKLLECLYKKKRRLYYACSFIYFLLIRPKELIRLKVDNIDFTNKTVTIHSGKSKNRKQLSVTIPRGLEKIIYEMGLDKADKSHYVFGYRQMTCERRSETINGMTLAHLDIARELNIDPNKTFYCWKHTGACALYNATKDPYIVMKQARHSNINITMIYLGALGLTVDEKIREAEFNFQ